MDFKEIVFGRADAHTEGEDYPELTAIPSRRPKQTTLSKPMHPTTPIPS